MSVVLLARLVGQRIRREHRIAWIDLLPHLLERAKQAEWRVFYLGGTQAVLLEGLSRLRRSHPVVDVDGANGYFDASLGSVDTERLIARINAARPQVLLVGMGMGEQERWVLANRRRLKVPVVAVCGACLEYFAGAMPMAPRWLSQLGLEWAFRLASDPKRFAWRYLAEPWLALAILLRAQWHQRAQAGP
jgi:N-acetylglucosaminyldiphosphoundecaprenol N-acetyl-beta-D-mannosaminyltransferase